MHPRKQKIWDQWTGISVRVRSSGLFIVWCFFAKTNLRHFVNNLEQKSLFVKRKYYSNRVEIISLYFQSSAANCDIYKGHKCTGGLLKHMHTWDNTRVASILFIFVYINTLINNLVDLHASHCPGHKCGYAGPVVQGLAHGEVIDPEVAVMVLYGGVVAALGVPAGVTVFC